jgi:hypothetical protein
MADLILYTSGCAKCKYKEEIRVARAFAAENYLNFVTRRTDYTKEYREELHNLTDLLAPVLFNEQTGKAIQFKGVTPSSISWLL